MLLRSNLSVVIIDVCRVLSANHFEFLITKLEFLQLEGGVNSGVFLESNPHVIWRVYLFEIFVLDLIHIFLNFLKFVKLCGFEGCRSLFQFVCHFFVIQAEVNIDDITIFHRYTLLANELLFDRCDHFLLEFADWGLVIVKITRLQELLVEFLSQSCLGRVVVNSH